MPYKVSVVLVDGTAWELGSQRRGRGGKERERSGWAHTRGGDALGWALVLFPVVEALAGPWPLCPNPSPKPRTLSGPPALGFPDGAGRPGVARWPRQGQAGAEAAGWLLGFMGRLEPRALS